MSGGFYYVVNMFKLRPTAPLVEMSLKYTIREFTFLKKLNFPRGGGYSCQFGGFSYFNSYENKINSSLLVSTRYYSV